MRIPRLVEANATPYDRQETQKILRQPGVEPGAKAWEASMLPIHHWRLLHYLSLHCNELFVQQKVFEGRIELPTFCV
jgi:hypothetical protein